MTLGIPSLFPPRGEFLVNFDWTDIAEATGIIEFKAFETTDSTGTIGNLSSNIVRSSSIEKTGTGGDETQFVLFIDKDYDLSSFNLPKSIKGTAYIRFSLKMERDSGTGPGDAEAYVIAKIKKDDAVIASVQTASITGNSGTITVIAKITIPKTHYKKGETLRLTMEGWCKAESNAVVTRLTFGNDPQNRDGTYIIPSGDATANLTTSINLWIPFELNI